MTTINITKYVKGSHETSPGDSTLYYTKNFSFEGQNICESLSDNEHRLAPDHSMFASYYSKSEDSYIFLHVQGQQWVFEGGARKYAYRGAFGISPNDVKTIGSMSTLVLNLPRISDITTKDSKNDPTRRVESFNTDDVTSGAQNLSKCIISAMTKCKRLYITVDRHDMGLAKGDALFNNQKFLTLLKAIDLLDVNMRMHASFTFLANSQLSSIVKQAAVNICFSDSNISAGADAIILNWKDAIASHCEPINTNICSFFGLESSNKMLTLNEIYSYIKAVPAIEEKVNEKKYSEMTKSDWLLWTLAGNPIDSIRVNSWKEYSQVKKALNIDQSVAFAQMILSPNQLNSINCSSVEEVRALEEELAKYGMLEPVIGYIWSYYNHFRSASLERLVNFCMRHPEIPSKYFKSLPFTEIGNEVMSFNHTNSDIKSWYMSKIKEYYSNDKPRTINDLRKRIEAGDRNSIGSLQELNDSDYKSIFSNATAEQTMQLFEAIGEDFGNNQNHSKIIVQIKKHVKESVNKHYPINEISRWPEFCSQMKSYPKYMELALNCYCENNDIDNIGRTATKYIQSLSQNNPRHFVKSAKPILSAVINGTTEADIHKQLKKQYTKTILPDSHNCLQLAIAVLVGFILCSSIFGAIHLLGKKSQSEGFDQTIATEPSSISMTFAQKDDKDTTISISDYVSPDAFNALKTMRLKYLVYENDTVKVEAKDFEQFSDTTKALKDPQLSAYHLIMYYIYSTAPQKESRKDSSTPSDKKSEEELTKNTKKQ